MVTLTLTRRVNAVDQGHTATATDHRYHRNRTDVGTGPQGVPLVLGTVPLEHRHTLGGRAGHAVEHGDVVARLGQRWLVFGRDVVDHERMAVIHSD
ncbi:hypothetical protein D3C76_1576000 [compost metagenome]